MSQLPKDIHIWQELSQQQRTQVTALLTQWAVKYLISQNQGAETNHGDHK